MKAEKIRLTSYTALNPYLWFFQKLNADRYLSKLQDNGSTGVVAKLHVKPSMKEEVVARVDVQAKNDPSLLKRIHGCDICCLPAVYSNGARPDLMISSVQNDRLVVQAEQCPAILGLLNLWRDNLITGKFAVGRMGKATCLQKRRRDIKVTIK